MARLVCPAWPPLIIGAEHTFASARFARLAQPLAGVSDPR